MMSEQECSKQLKKPLLYETGKYAGKQMRDKKGKPKFIYTTVPDPSKQTRHELFIDKEVPAGAKKPAKPEKERIVLFTRNCKKVSQTLNMGEEAYNYFISGEVPAGFKAPQGFKASQRLLKKGIGFTQQAWLATPPQQRLMWHLNRTCEALGGTLLSYTIFDD